MREKNIISISCNLRKYIFRTYFKSFYTDTKKKKQKTPKLLFKSILFTLRNYYLLTIKSLLNNVYH